MDLVTNAVKEAAVEASTSLLAEIKKHVAFLYKYKNNLEDLEKARILLDAMRRDASNYSVDAEKRFKKVGEAFVQWQSEADKLHQKAENIISKNNISCFHIWSRYSTSKHAWELTQDIHEKVDKAPDFGNSFDIEIPEGAKFNLIDFTDFDSRKEILKKVLKALGDEHVSMCSICGMGGIGKTTMAQNIVQIVEAGHFFDKVAMVTVSQNPNFENIQKAIMEKLGLPIGESDMSTRANKLNHWLSNHKTLLILDDVWDSLLEKFDDVGIPLAKNMCKIVVTSRNEHECKKMGSKPIFCLKVLDGREAWDLFIKIAGNLQETAREIVRECNGLPIAIVTIARALTDKPAGAWGDSLKKLRNSNLLGIPDMDSVYKKIEVSYDLLKDPEAQSCLRYCCLFPEDYNVPVEKLVFYGWGLELFKGVESLKEARDRVDSIVDKLKKSFLLLDGEGDGDGDGYVKLHDIVRDFAIWISLNDIHPYIVKCNKEMEKWPEACELEKCSAISIVCNTIQDVIPVELRCPNLKLLQLHVRDDSCELPIGFLEGMEELRVVDLQLGSRLPPLTRQKNLRTLLIKSNRVGEMEDPIYIREMLDNGDMKNLEIFSLSCTHFSDFPVEIGKLSNLRCLRFKQVSFEYMPPDVLSKLVKLEELRLPLPFINWGCREVWGDRRVNASLNEIESLPLNSINITVPKGSVLAEKFVSSITRFQIFFGSYDSRFLWRKFFINLIKRKFGSDPNVLIVHEVDACEATANWTSSLLRKCDLLIFEKVRELKYIMFQQSRGNNDSGFPCTYFSHLKTLVIGDMDSLEEIWHDTYMLNIESACFPNLTKIKISRCQKLKHVFPLAVAMQLPQLQHMEVTGCEEMEEIFYKDQVDNENQVQVDTSTSTQVFNPNDPTDQIMEECNDREVEHAIVLPRLKVLLLREMPKLRILCNGNHAIECPSLEVLRIEDCNIMEALSYGSFNAPITKELELEGVRSIKNSIPKWLNLKQTNGTPRVRKLQIGRCNETKYLVDTTDSHDPNLLKAFFSRLEHLKIQQMDSLEAIWNGPYLSNIQRTKFPNLTHITILHCPMLKRVFPLSVATELKQLVYMQIRSSSEMEEIFYNDKIVEEIIEKVDERDGDHVVVLPLLKYLDIQFLPKLRSLCKGNHVIECPSLEEVNIKECNSMEALFFGSFNAPITKLTISGCQEMKCLVDPNLPKAFFSRLEALIIDEMDSLEEIWHRPYFPPCFPNLTQIEIYDCPKLKRVFPLSVATQLQSMKIIRCGELEEIFYNDQIVEESIETDGDHVVVLPLLKELDIQFLPKLRSLCKGNHVIECPSLEEVYIKECNSMEALFFGSFNAPITKLTISPFHEMKCLVDPNLPKTFYSRLELLIIDKMDSLEEIWHGPYFPPCFPNLTQIEIYKCPKLKRVFPLSVATQLQSMMIICCGELEEIFYNDQSVEENSAKLDEKEADKAMDAFIFPKLRELQLWQLSKLRILYDGNHSMELPSLEIFVINGCNNIEALSKGSFKAPILQEIEINDTKYPCGEDLNTIVRETLNEVNDVDDEAEEEVKDETETETEIEIEVDGKDEDEFEDDKVEENHHIANYGDK